MHKLKITFEKNKNSLYGFKDWKIIIKVPFCTNIHGNMSYIALYFLFYKFFQLLILIFFPSILFSFCVWRNFKVESERDPLPTGMGHMTWGNSTTDTKKFMLFLCIHMHLPFSEQRNYSGSQPFYMYTFICIFRKRTDLIHSSVSENW